MNVVLIYDDGYIEDAGAGYDTRVRAIMAIVEEMFSEKELNIEMNTVAFIHAEGRDWRDTQKWDDYYNDELYDEAKKSGYDANSYIFLTGKKGLHRPCRLTGLP